LNLKVKILKISSSKTIEIESEMMGGGYMGKNGYESQASFSSIKFNGVEKRLKMTEKCYLSIIILPSY